METTSANKSIGLSYSRANEHCGKRIYYNDVVKMPRTYNYYSASGTLMEEMVASQLRPMIDGSPTVPMKQAGLKAIDEMISMLPKDDLQQVMDELDASVTGAERYLETVDYTPLVLQQKGVLRFSSMARETKLVIDLLMNRGGEDVIVDFKRKPKKLSDYKISQQDWNTNLHYMPFGLCVLGYNERSQGVRSMCCCRDLHPKLYPSISMRKIFSSRLIVFRICLGGLTILIFLLTATIHCVLRNGVSFMFVVTMTISLDRMQSSMQSVMSDKKERILDMYPDTQFIFYDDIEDALIGVVTRFGQEPILCYDYYRCLAIYQERTEYPTMRPWNISSSTS